MRKIIEITRSLIVQSGVEIRERRGKTPKIYATVTLWIKLTGA